MKNWLLAAILLFSSSSLLCQTTSTLNLALPADGTENWGAILNDNFTLIDSAISATSAANKIPLANGSGQIAIGFIPSLDASKITTGVFDKVLIAGGTLTDGRILSLQSGSIVADGQLSNAANLLTYTGLNGLFTKRAVLAPSTDLQSLIIYRYLPGQTSNPFEYRIPSTEALLGWMDPLGGLHAPFYTSSDSTNAGFWGCGQGIAQGISLNTIGFTCGTSITGYNYKFPSAASTGLLRGDNSANIVTVAQSELTGVINTSASNVTTPGKVDVMQSSLFCLDAAANDTYACSLSPAATAYVTGTQYRFKANTANTGAATVNFNAIGAKTIVKMAGGITTALADNDIRAGQWVTLVYDGTNMQMTSQLGN